MSDAAVGSVVGWIAAGVAAVGAAPAERPADAMAPERQRTVEVADAGGDLCSSPRRTGSNRVVGGCQVVLESDAVDIVVLTPYGEFRFARCASRFVLQVGPSGRGYLLNSTMQGDSPCGDARPCGFGMARTVLRPPEPQSLRIFATAAGDRLIRLGACLDTCIGTVRGPLELRLRETGNRLEAAPRAPIGTSGVELRGTWTADRSQVSISPI